MKAIEKELWDYIDGVSTPQEQSETAERIRQDPAVAVLYRELLSFHTGLAGLEPEQPSMGFTRNVMDAVRQAPAPAPVVIDKRLIIGISAFFGTVFLVLFSVLLFSVDSAQEPVLFPADLSIPPAVHQAVSDGKYMTVFYMADVVLALYMLDGFLRKRLLSKKL